MFKRKAKTLQILFSIVSIFIIVTTVFLFTNNKTDIDRSIKNEKQTISNSRNLKLLNNSSDIRIPGTDEFNQYGPIEIDNSNSILIYSGQDLINERFSNKQEYTAGLGSIWYDAYKDQKNNQGIDGSVNNPWKVTNAEQFIAMLRDSDSDNQPAHGIYHNYKLEKNFVINLDAPGASSWMQNVILNGRSKKLELKDFSDNSNHKSFKGTLDGDGKFIWFSKFDKSTYDVSYSALLFGYLSNSAVIKDVNFIFTNVIFSQDVSSLAWTNGVGMLAAKSHAQIYDCYFYMDKISLELSADTWLGSTAMHVYVGGLFGFLGGKVFSNTFDIGDVSVGTGKVDGSAGFGAIAGSLAKSRSINPTQREQGCFSGNLVRKIAGRKIIHKRQDYKYYDDVYKNRIQWVSAGPLFGVYGLDWKGSYIVSLNAPPETTSVDINNQQVIVSDGQNLENDFESQKLVMEYPSFMSDDQVKQIPMGSRNNHIFNSDDSYRIYWSTGMPLYYMRQWIDASGRHIRPNKYKFQRGENIPTIAFNFDSKQVNSINNRSTYTVLELDSNISNPQIGAEYKYQIPLDKSAVLMRDLSVYISNIKVLNPNRAREYNGQKDVEFEFNFNDSSNDLVNIKSDFNVILKNNYELDSKNAGERSLIIKNTASTDSDHLFVKNSSDKILFVLSLSKLAILSANQEAKLNINPKNINSIVFDDSKVIRNKVYDGNTNVNINAGYSITSPDILSGDNVIFEVLSKNFENKNAATSKKINIEFSKDGVDKDNYVFANSSNHLVLNDGVITAKTVNISFDTIECLEETKMYDGNTSLFDLNAIRFSEIEEKINGDDVSFALVSASYNSKDVLDADRIISIFKLSGSSASNYKINGSNSEGEYTKEFNNKFIVKRQLTVQPSDVLGFENKVYDRTSTYTLKGTETVKDNTTAVSGETVKFHIEAAEFTSSGYSETNKLTVLVKIEDDFTDNYIFENDSDEIYVELNYQILKAPISVEATNEYFTITKKIYDSSLSYDSGKISVVKFNGKLVDDDVSVVISNDPGQLASLEDKNALANTNLSFYIKLNGSEKNNYSIVNNHIVINGVFVDKRNINLVNINNSIVHTSKPYDGTTAVIIDNEESVENYISSNDVLSGDDFKFTIISKEYNDKNVGDNKTIRFVFGKIGTDASNYEFAANANKYTMNGIIVKKSINVDNIICSENSKVYDGKTSLYNPSSITLVDISSSVINTEDVRLELVSAEYNSKDVAGANSIRVIVKLVGADISNYNLSSSQDDGTYEKKFSASITKYKLILSSSDLSGFENKVYDRTATYTLKGTETVKDNTTVVSGETVKFEILSASFNYANYSLDNKLNVIVKLKDTFIANYMLKDDGSDRDTVVLNYTITKAPITLGATEEYFSIIHKIYDSNTSFDINNINVLKFDGKVNDSDDVLVVISDDIAHQAIIADKNAQRTTTLTFYVKLIGADSINYEIANNQMIINGIFVDKKEINTYVYSNLFDTTVTYFNSEDAEVKSTITSNDVYPIDQANVTFTVKTAKYDNKNAGTNRTINVVLNDFIDTTGNYIQTLKTFTVSGITIEKKAITTTNALDAVNKEKEYNATNEALLIDSFTITSSDVIAGDTINFSILSSTYDSKDAGENKTITLVIKIDESSLSYANYTLVNNTITTNDGKISPKQINITKEMLNITSIKEYDGNASLASEPTLKSEYNSLIEASDVTLVSLVFTGTYDSANKGDRLITVNISLNSANTNYTLVTTVINGINGRITELTLVITVSDVIETINASLDKTFDNTNIFKEDLIISNDKIDRIKDEFNNILVKANITYASKLVGNQQLTAIFTISGSDADKYIIQDDNLVIGNGSILVKELNPNSLWFTDFADTEKEYDSSDVYNGMVTISSDFGQIGGDSDITLTITSKRYSNKNVGDNKTIILDLALSGDNASCYALTSSSYSFSNSFNKITKKQLTLADVLNIPFVKEKVYDGNTNITEEISTSKIYSQNLLTGLFSDEKVTLFATVIFSDVNVGNNKDYTLSLILEGEDSANYIIINPITNASYSDGRISEAELTITSSINIDYIREKTYDGLTTIATTQIDFNTINNLNILDGLIDNDIVSLNVDIVFDDKNVGNNKGYKLTIVLFGNDSANYKIINPITNESHNDGKIKKRSIRLSDIDNIPFKKEKVYNGDTNIVSHIDKATIKSFNLLSSLIDGDDISLDATVILSDINVGDNKDAQLSISLAGLDSLNYEIENSVSALAINNAKVTKLDVSFVPNILSKITYNKEKIYDGNDYIVEYKDYDVSLIDGILPLDNDNVKIKVSLKFNNKNVGDNKAHTVSISLSGDRIDNYNVTNTFSESFNDGKIIERIITVTSSDININSASKVYDTTDKFNGELKINIPLIENDDIGFDINAKYDSEIAGDRKLLVNISLKGSDKANYTLATSNIEMEGKEINITKLRLNIVMNKLKVKYKSEITKELLKDNIIFKNALGEIENIDKTKYDIDFEIKEISKGAYAVTLKEINIQNYDLTSYEHTSSDLNGENKVIEVLRKISLTGVNGSYSYKYISILIGIMLPLLLITLIFGVIISKRRNKRRNFKT